MQSGRGLGPGRPWHDHPHRGGAVARGELSPGKAVVAPLRLVHGNIGWRSNRAHPEAERAEVLALIERHYTGSVAKGPGQRFGPTLVAEHLWLDHGRPARALWGARATGRKLSRLVRRARGAGGQPELPDEHGG